jgi:hypothetical protein
MIHWLAARWHWEQAESAESIIMARAMLVKLGRAEITVAASFSPRHLSHTPIMRIICCVYPFGVSGFSVMNSDAAKSHSTNSASGGKHRNQNMSAHLS